jgi:hypothetical protein
MPKPDRHAASDTLLGQLQRGRGSGYIGVLSVPKLEAEKLLVECICNDPRLDSQVESRSGYYASIASAIGLNLGLLADYLRENDDKDESSWNSPLTVDTLGELAKRGHGTASDIICDYVHWGQSWYRPLFEDVMASLGADIKARIISAIEKRFPSDEELATALEWFSADSEPGATLAQNSERIKKNLQKTVKRDPRQLPSSEELASMTAKQLLDLADEKNWHKLNKVIANVVTPSDLELLKDNTSIDRPFVADVAMAGLAKLATDDLFDWLREYWHSNPKMRGFIRRQVVKIMISLSTKLTLPLARERLFHEECHERFLAEEILEVHAEEADIPLLRRAIKQGLQDDNENCYRLCNLTEAFGHLPDIGPVPELVDVFAEFRYSYGRWEAAQAISVTNSSLFRERFASECLWDCEGRTRVLGARFAPTENDVARRRLDEIVSNHWEDKKVLDEARKRTNSDAAI